MDDLFSLLIWAIDVGAYTVNPGAIELPESSTHLQLRAILNPLLASICAATIYTVLCQIMEDKTMVVPAIVASIVLAILLTHITTSSLRPEGLSLVATIIFGFLRFTDGFLCGTALRELTGNELSQRAIVVISAGTLISLAVTGVLLAAFVGGEWLILIKLILGILAMLVGTAQLGIIISPIDQISGKSGILIGYGCSLLVGIWVNPTILLPYFFGFVFLLLFPLSFVMGSLCNLTREEKRASHH